MIPIKRVLLMGGAAIALLIGSYLLGRWDAPSRDDAVTTSLLDGIDAYHTAFNKLTQQLNAARDSMTAGIKRERVLAALRTPTPVMVPAACAPWETNLSTCDRQLGELRSTIEVTGGLLAMAEQGRAADSARTDSVTKALDREVGKGKILGISLPSRRTSFAAGGVLGALATGGACLLLTR